MSSQVSSIPLPESCSSSCSKININSRPNGFLGNHFKRASLFKLRKNSIVIIASKTKIHSNFTKYIRMYYSSLILSLIFQNNRIKLGEERLIVIENRLRIGCIIKNSMISEINLLSILPLCSWEMRLDLAM